MADALISPDVSGTMWAAAAGLIGYCGGYPLTPENLKTVLRALGMVFHNPDDQLFMPTVFDDVAFGPLNLGIAAELQTHKGDSLTQSRYGILFLRADYSAV